MKCVKCKKPGTEKAHNLPACKRCFSLIIEKRVKKELRQNKLLKKGDKILVVDDGSPEAAVTLYILKHLGIELEIQAGSSIKKNQNFKKIALPWSADMEGKAFLDSIINKKRHKPGHYKEGSMHFIKLLLPVSEREIISYAKIKGLRYKKSKKKDIFSSLYEEYPEISFNLMKSSLKVGKT